MQKKRKTTKSNAARVTTKIPNLNHKKLNKETLKAIADVEQGTNLIAAQDAEDLFKKLGI